MMPFCSHRRCKQVATTSLGKINQPDPDMPNGVWEQVTYVCDKHYKKILKLLGVKS